MILVHWTFSWIKCTYKLLNIFVYKEAKIKCGRPWGSIVWHFPTLIFYLAFHLAFFALFSKIFYKIYINLKKKIDLFFQIIIYVCIYILINQSIYIYIYIYISRGLMGESLRFCQVEHSSFRTPPQQNYIYVNLIMYNISSLNVFLD